MESQDKLIQVPDLSTSELMKHLGLERIFRRVGVSLSAYDFASDGRGKQYESKVWSPGVSMAPVDARKHFSDGFTGNAAAFVVWAVQTDPEGRFVTVPEDDQLFTLDGSDQYAPTYSHQKGRPWSSMGGVFGLTQNDARNIWLPHWSYVAFREILPVAAAVALAVPKIQAA